MVGGRKVPLDGNGLRTPNTDEWKNLPKSPLEAKNRGLNVYQDESDTQILMRFKNRAKINKFVKGLKYEPEKVTERKANRGGNTNRLINEKVSTPPQTRTQRREFGGTMTSANQQGYEGDHNIPVSRSGNALRTMSFIRRVLYWNRLAKVNQYTGNQKQNITHRTPAENKARNTEFNKLDKAIDKLNKSKPDPFGFKRGKVKVINYSKVNGRVITSGPIQTDSGKPQVDMGFNMDQLAPLSRSHIIPGGRVAPIDYI